MLIASKPKEIRAERIWYDIYENGSGSACTIIQGGCIRSKLQEIIACSTVPASSFGRDSICRMLCLYTDVLVEGIRKLIYG